MGMCWMCYYRAGLGWGCVGVLPWTLSALVLGGAAAGRGHVITGHTAPVTSITTRD